MLRDIMNLFEHKEYREDSYEPVIVNSFWSNNYYEYKSKDVRNKTLSVEEYFNKIRP